MTPLQFHRTATRVVAPPDHNWGICRYTRPGSGNLVYNEDADPFWKDNRKPKNKSKKAVIFVLVCIIGLAYYLH